MRLLGPPEIRGADVPGALSQSTVGISSLRPMPVSQMYCPSKTADSVEEFEFALVVKVTRAEGPK